MADRRDAMLIEQAVSGDEEYGPRGGGNGSGG